LKKSDKSNENFMAIKSEGDNQNNLGNEFEPYEQSEMLRKKVD